MAAKKKTRKKQTKSKRSPRKKSAPSRKAAKKRAIPKKKLARKSAKRNSPAKTKAPAKKATGTKAANLPKRRARERSQTTLDGVASISETRQARRGGLSGDLQGLSSVETANSESVDELLEEGNAFEAGVVTGVEEADIADEKEVHTREVPEDDVPAEYLDKD